jgi:hypothetical protein
MTVEATRQNPQAPTVGRSVSQTEFRVETLALPAWVHPEVVYWYPVWIMIRDAIEGERQVKEKGQAYLPRMEGQDASEYAGYLKRATYYNFTGRTVAAMTGAIFRREALVSGLDEEQKAQLQSLTPDGLPMMTLATMFAEEMLSVGRVGALVEVSPVANTFPKPYIATYTAENILDWDEITLPDGRRTLARVVLREGKQYRDSQGARKFAATYRELKLEPSGAGGFVYTQYLYAHPNGVEDAQLSPEHRSPAIVPNRRGTPLDFIPFLLLGPFKSTPSVEKPPMQDIAQLNMSHFRSYAQLEHGRYYTGFPIYYLEDGAQNTIADAEFEIAPNRVWKSPAGSKPGILEFNGQGLKHLENALDLKEQQAAALGGRMMGIRALATSESDNQLKLSERNEQSVLLKTTRALDAGMRQLLRWWLWWQGGTEAEVAKVDVAFNKDFLFDGVGAREFRAVHAMYKDGVVPIEVLFHYLKRGDVVPDWMTVEEFKSMLDSMESFPNNPDFEARQNGYPNRQSEIDDENEDEDRKSGEKTAAAAAKAAAARPPAPAGPARPGSPPGGPPPPRSPKAPR